MKLYACSVQCEIEYPLCGKQIVLHYGVHIGNKLLITFSVIPNPGMRGFLRLTYNPPGKLFADSIATVCLSNGCLIIQCLLGFLSVQF